MILSCSHITKTFGGDNILSEVSFHINDNEKCAIVGINGVGKTTLLRIITGELSSDGGEIIFSKNASFGYLRQHQSLDSGNTIYEEIKSAKKDIFELEKRIRQLENKMRSASDAELEKMYLEYNRSMTEYERLGGYACESEITGIIKGLGFSEDSFNQKINTLSGGEKTRIALGRILLSSPDLIILDEPTNHLDMNSVSWLENYLANYKGAVLIVAHDRYFLDKTVTKTIELDNGKCTVFDGNYSAYSEKKKLLRESMLKAYYKQQQEISHQEEVIKKLKSFNREKSIKRAESREKMLARIDRIEKPYEINSEMKITFKPAIESGNDVLSVEGISKSFDDNYLFSNISFEIKKGERIAIIGDNGTGKTTILKIINELLPADSGIIKLGSNVCIGYYDQEHQMLSPEKTIFDEISDTYPYMTNTEIRNILAAFLFTNDDVFKLIKDISGGERGRVAIAKLMLSDANFLILDEPTNHLDIVSKEILENALLNYTGTVLYVSHDRYFINRTATGILHLTEHHINKYIGNYDYFLEKKEAVELAYQKNTTDSTGYPKNSIKTGTSEIESLSSKDSWEKQKEQKANAKRIRSLLTKCENDIAETEKMLENVDSELANPDNGYNPVLLNELTEKRSLLSSSLDTLMEEWERLSEEAEKSVP